MTQISLICSFEQSALKDSIVGCSIMLIRFSMPNS